MKVHQRLYFVLVFKLLYLRKMRDLQNYFASKTPYNIVENLNVEEISSKGFGKPHKIWMVIRHGTRFPSITQVRKINSELPSIYKKILKHSNENLSNFETELLTCATKKLPECNCSKLTQVGKQEMRSLAKRIKERFADFFIWEYDEKICQFRLTDTDRTLESAQQFASGLFGKVVLKNSSVKYRIEERLLRFYKLCTKWRRQVRYNPSSLNEKMQFQNTSVALSAVAMVNEKLGLNDILSFDDIEIIYKTCVIETCNNKLTAWCLPFTRDIMKVIEYSEDLKHYWLDGYGYDITYKHACPLFKNMMDFLNSDKEYPKVVFNFTHSGALLKFITHLQLYRDDKPLSHNDFDNSGKRKWRVSKICGFGSNIIIGGKRKLLVLHQEKIIRLPCCPNSDLCDFDVLEEYYRSSLTDCNFDKICENS